MKGEVLANMVRMLYVLKKKKCGWNPMTGIKCPSVLLGPTMIWVAKTVDNLVCTPQSGKCLRPTEEVAEGLGHYNR